MAVDKLPGSREADEVKQEADDTRADEPFTLPVFSSSSRKDGVFGLLQGGHGHGEGCLGVLDLKKRDLKERCLCFLLPIGFSIKTLGALKEVESSYGLVLSF